jgi:hypothetical protein
MLGPGTFTVSATLTIKQSGVVVYGSGSGPDGTVITMTKRFLLFQIFGSGSPVPYHEVYMTDSYVPSGATTFSVASTEGFQVGDEVVINRPVTNAWIDFLGMNKLVRDDGNQTWLRTVDKFRTYRTIIDLSGEGRVELDAPLTDSFDPKYLNPSRGSMAKYTFPGRISNVGLENFAVKASGHFAEENPYQVASIDCAINAWIRNVTAQDTLYSFTVGRHAKGVTLDNVQVVHTFHQPNVASPADFNFVCTQILVNKCSVLGNGGTFPFITYDMVTGPIVLLKCSADEAGLRHSNDGQPDC